MRRQQRWPAGRCLIIVGTKGADETPSRRDEHPPPVLCQHARRAVMRNVAARRGSESMSRSRNNRGAGILLAVLLVAAGVGVAVYVTKPAPLPAPAPSAPESVPASAPAPAPAASVEPAAAAVPVTDQCQVPGPAPAMPRATVATAEDMKIQHDAIQGFVKALEAYQACVNDLIEHPPAGTDERTRQILVTLSDHAIDRAHALADAYAEQEQVFKARQAEASPAK